MRFLRNTVFQGTKMHAMRGLGVQTHVYSPDLTVGQFVRMKIP